MSNQKISLEKILAQTSNNEQLKDLNEEQLKEKAAEIIKNLKEKANQIELKEIDQEEFNNNKTKYVDFLLYNPIYGFDGKTIDVEDYINRFDIFKYSIDQGIDTSLMYEIPEQLAYINKLGKIFNHDFITVADVDVKFTRLDLMCCDFIKQYKEENNFNDVYKIVYTIFEKFVFKLLVSSCTMFESAFKSKNIWVNDQFKLATKEDVIMLHCLQDKFFKSFTIFCEELSRTKEAFVFNSIEHLPSISMSHKDLELEMILASSIKGMTPMFIYDYFSAMKSLYIGCSLINIYLNKVENKTINKSVEELINDIAVIAAVSSLIYQNTSLKQHGSTRQLPQYKDEIDEKTQMYYLNHTIYGPQFILMKIFEKAIPVLGCIGK